MIQTLLNWYELRPQILFSILIPTFISVLCFIYCLKNHTFPEIKMGVGFILVCSALGFEWSFWDETEESLSLHVIQIGFIVTAFLVFLRINISPAFVYLATFLSDLWVDFAQAYWFHPNLEDFGGVFYLGIGGGGMGDALFLYPLFSSLLIFYGNLRIQGTWKNSNSRHLL
ncbi:MAG TPA: hypothetical protein VIY47_00700, partial [Ignavibacteriaceae bacterium]